MPQRPVILFLTKSGQAASTRYRALNHFDRLREAGWEPQLIASDDPAVKRRDLPRRAGEADVVVICRKTWSWFMRRKLRQASRRVVFDFDDAIYTTPAGASASRQRRFAGMIRQCDLVWAGNDHLVQYARRLHSCVMEIPTAVDPTAYDRPPQRPKDVFDVVWIGGSATRPYLEAALPWLEVAARRIPSLRLKIIADFDLPAARIPTLAVQWRGDLEAAELASSYVGIAPMPDDDWTRGKCGLKVLQYMAARLPVVASDAGVHRQIIISQKTGLLCDSPRAWEEALVQLHAQQSWARGLGLAGRARVEQHYAIQRVTDTMIASLETLR